MGFFDRWRRKPVDDGIDQTAYDVLDEVEPDDEMIDEAVSEHLLPGFLRFDDVVEAVVEWYADDVPDEAAFRSAVVGRARPIWDARRREERSWRPDTSQHDRLQRAFRQLRTLGFVTGTALGVDQADGFREARDLRTPDRDAPGGFREWAYVYFHAQDAEGLCLARHVLRLAFGSFRPAPDIDQDLVAKAMLSSRGEAAITERSHLAAGHQVAEVLTDHGFDVDWDGTAGRRIGVVVDQWRKALPFSDLDEARRVVADERLRVRWPGEPTRSDAAALEEQDGRWHVWGTDERGGPWSPGTWHDDLGEALDRLVEMARTDAPPADR